MTCNVSNQRYVWRAAALASALFCAGLGAAPNLARADRQHLVQPGQSLASIAKHYDVTIWSLAAANRITPDATVRAGQSLSVPEKGTVYVNDGQTLWSVARRHGCTVEALARANGLTPTTSLRPGMRLTLPGHKPSEKDVDGGGRNWGKPKRTGKVDLFRVTTQQRLSLSILDPRGRVRPESVKQLARFLKPRNSDKTKSPDRRLIGLLAQISDHFGGRRIHVISGYRVAGGYTSHESRHTKAAAIDSRVEGVPNRVLRDYLRHFNDVGVGFYPNSTFVHFDVRSENAYWVDLSGPGEKPTYLRRDERDGFDDKSRAEGLAEVGEVVEAALEDMEHAEPGDGDANAADE